MPAPWTVRTVQPNNGILRVHMSRDVHGQPEDIWLNIMPETESQAFMEGDVRGASFPLIQRSGRNGKDRV